MGSLPKVFESLRYTNTLEIRTLSPKDKALWLVGETWECFSIAAVASHNFSDVSLCNSWED